jgi:hypothetical protein
MFLQKAKTKMKKGGAILFARTFYAPYGLPKFLPLLLLLTKRQ